MNRRRLINSIISITINIISTTIIIIFFLVFSSTAPLQNKLFLSPPWQGRRGPKRAETSPAGGGAAPHDALLAWGWSPRPGEGCGGHVFFRTPRPTPRVYGPPRRPFFLLPDLASS